MPPSVNVILLRYGEIALRGRNKPDSLNSLRGNITARLESAQMRWPVSLSAGGCRVRIPEDQGHRTEQALDVVRAIPGVVWYAPSHRISVGDAGLEAKQPAWECITERVVEWARERFRPGQSFRVRVTRALKSFPLSSPKIEARLGDAICRETPWEHVRLNDPDYTIHVEVRRDGVYLYDQRRSGSGGLPVGSAGRVVALLSGGIDSPVAAYLMARRGCRIDFVHFSTAYPNPDAIAQDKVTRLAARLSRFTLRSRLYVLPYGHFEIAMLGQQSRYELVLFRAFMADVAGRIARVYGIPALVVGDCLGQVASQTLENMVAVTRSTDLPILRPLIGFDKQEIVTLARQIGTYDISIEPDKDCCSIISRRPKTRSFAEVIRRERDRLLGDQDRLIETTLADGLAVTLAHGAVSGVAPIRNAALVGDPDSNPDHTRRPNRVF